MPWCRLDTKPTRQDQPATVTARLNHILQSLRMSTRHLKYPITLLFVQQLISKKSPRPHKTDPLWGVGFAGFCEGNPTPHEGSVKRKPSSCQGCYHSCNANHISAQRTPHPKKKIYIQFMLCCVLLWLYHWPILPLFSRISSLVQHNDNYGCITDRFYPCSPGFLHWYSIMIIMAVSLTDFIHVLQDFFIGTA